MSHWFLLRSGGVEINFDFCPLQAVVVDAADVAAVVRKALTNVVLFSAVQ